jgi:lipopolysaccharide/colanic/teichoic acid biosynthesis glycosyltransferase
MTSVRTFTVLPLLYAFFTGFPLCGLVVMSDHLRRLLVLHNESLFPPPSSLILETPTMTSEPLTLPREARPSRVRTTPPLRYSTATHDKKLIHLPPPRQLWGYLPAKRALDVGASATALLVLAPLFLLVAALIKLTSPGPIFFRSQRVGEGGHIFTMLKFRSMRSDADHRLHKQQYMEFLAGRGNGKVSQSALDGDGSGHSTAAGEQRKQGWFHSDDPRVTTVGAFIRRTSIDELPQLFNVLRGEMSLVGPRPPIPYEVRHYEPEHLVRLAVCPGLTGIWQVYGRNKVPFDIMVYMDQWYIEHRSLYLDVKLIVLTLPVIILARARD